MASTPDTDDCDSEAARLLPWFATGRIDADDAARVQAHLASCATCRADLAAQRQWRDLLRSDEKVEYSPQPSLQKLMSRIEELDREMAPAAASSTQAVEAEPAGAGARAGLPRWLVAAVVLQTLGLGLLGSMLWQHAGTRGADAEYVTLSSVERPAGERSARASRLHARHYRSRHGRAARGRSRRHRRRADGGGGIHAGAALSG